MIELAKSGRSTCRSCREKIAKGVPRFGRPDESIHRNAIAWHHLACAAQAFPEAFREAVAEFGVDPDDPAAVEALLDGRVDGSSAARPTKKRGPRASKSAPSDKKLRAMVQRHVDDYEVERAVATLKKHRAEAWPAWLYATYSSDWLSLSPAVDDLLNEAFVNLPAEEIESCLQRLDAPSAAEPLPGLGSRAALHLWRLAMDPARHPALRRADAVLPTPLRAGLWLALCHPWHTDRAPTSDIPQEIVSWVREQWLPHLLSGAMNGDCLDPLIDVFGLDTSSALPAVEARLERFETLPICTFGWMLGQVPHETFLSAAPRLDFRVADSGAVREHWLEAFIEDRAARMGSTPDERCAELLALPVRMRPSLRELWALRVATAFVDAGRELPDDLLPALRKTGLGHPSWRRLLRTLSSERARSWHDDLRETLPKKRRKTLTALEPLFAGEPERQQDLERLLAALATPASAQTEQYERVAMHGVAILPLIDAAEAALKREARPGCPDGSGDLVRRSLSALLQLRVWIWSDALSSGQPLPPSVVQTIVPDREVFTAPHRYFFFGIRGGIKHILAALDEASLQRWIDDWLAYASGDPELEHLIQQALPPERMSALPGLPSRDERLADAIGRLSEPASYEVYTMERGAASSAGYSRLGVSPDGVGPADMEPVLCLDLNDLPQLAQRYPGKRALILFVDDPHALRDEPEIDAELVAVTEQQCASMPEGEPLQIKTWRVPPTVFEGRSQDPQHEVYRLLCQYPGRVLGKPSFLQSESPASIDPTFLFQADDSLLEMNLGDSGVLYAFEGDRVVWECF